MNTRPSTAGRPVAACLLLGMTAAVAGPPPIAGTEPSRRPLSAPAIETLHRPDGWHREALAGISEPHPPGLRFLQDQGNWYTPFDRPGMPGRYDLRGWHGRSRAPSVEQEPRAPE
jgi:hypothetical protein